MMRAHRQSSRKRKERIKAIPVRPPNICPVCGIQGGVTDTRTGPNYVRRRRFCYNLKHPRWTTVEFLVYDTHHGGQISAADAFVDHIRGQVMQIAREATTKLMALDVKPLGGKL